MWSGERLTKVQTTTGPDHVWPEAWTKIGQAAQKREKQEWANEKPELDNARRMRGTYFIDPRQGLARRMAHSPAMLFKQTCHPHFSSFPRLRANCRVLGPLAPPVSRACLEDRPVQPAPDRPSCRSCRGTQDPHVVLIPACWPRTSTALGM